LDAALQVGSHQSRIEGQNDLITYTNTQRRRKVHEYEIKSVNLAIKIFHTASVPVPRAFFLGLI